MNIISHDRRMYFLQAIEDVYHQHGISLAHEDHHGSFLIEPCSSHNIYWLWQARSSSDAEIEYGNNMQVGGQDDVE